MDYLIIKKIGVYQLCIYKDMTFMAIDNFGRSDWPVWRESGEVLWDHPEWFSKTVRESFAKTILRIGRLNEVRL